MKTGEIIRDFRFLCFILLSPNDYLQSRNQGFMWVLLATSLIFWGDDGTNPTNNYNKQEISQNLHVFALFDPPKMGNLMIPDKTLEIR